MDILSFRVGYGTRFSYPRNLYLFNYVELGIVFEGVCHQKPVIRYYPWLRQRPDPRETIQTGNWLLQQAQN